LFQDPSYDDTVSYCRLRDFGGGLNIRQSRHDFKDPNVLPMVLFDDHIWRDRSELWSRRASRDTAGRAKRERPRWPLILTGHGVSLRIEGGALTIRNGFRLAASLFRGEPVQIAGWQDTPERVVSPGVSDSLQSNL
jgi:hypothetical protein